jgi:hypothetical protein
MVLLLELHVMCLLMRSISFKFDFIAFLQVHVMCLLMRGRFLNQMCNDLILRGVALSLLPQEFSAVPHTKYDITTHTRLVNWYRATIVIDPSVAEDDQKLPLVHLGFIVS